jgi:ubiquitin C-terminal hydrolase
MFKLKNLGNTCYINSVLQCFLYNPTFIRNCNLQKLKECFVGTEVNLTTFINYFFNLNKDFKMFEQNDSHEFLVKFLDLLTSEVHGRLEIPKITNDHFNVFLKNNNFSPFINEYYGQTKLKVTCMNCNKSSDSFEEFSSINLEVPETVCSVSDLLIKYLKSNIEDDPNNLYYCNGCASNQKSCHKNTINILPRTLIIVLKRYSSNGKKIQSEIALDPVLHIKQNGIVIKYNLVAVVNHFGNLYDGHYTSNVFIDKEWYHFDDDIITKQKNFRGAYILFYSV